MNIGNIDMNGAYIGSEEVTKIYQGNTVIFEKETDYSKMPLTFEITGDGDINWLKRRSIAPTVTIEYRVNDGEWISVTNTSTTGYRFNVISGDTVEFRGDNAAYSGNYWNGFSGTTCQFNVKGNIMSLINSTDFSGLTTLTSTFTFESLFRETPVISAEHLLLPATTLTSSCYTDMFSGCTSLTTAPVLPAETLKNDCYRGLFQGCINLNYIKCLATDISASQSTQNWVNGVQTASGTFVTPSTTNWSTGTSGIPENWTRVDV